MYVVTFYSFKGGVGRSMALVNAGLELVRRGKRVLMVDFDLEAPGLDTFPLLRPKTPTKGIVDFVEEYEATGISPNVEDFVYQVDLQKSLTGSAFVMPTGLADEAYGSRLNGIDWQQLYSERDGFVLLEDVKEQWRRSIRPDYVLIDSRTGHTDVGGICTRQLPDAVALLFFPNEQNERGIRTVVEDIRAEKGRTGKEVVLHFVASNVPNLDDEDKILFQRIKRIRETLADAEPEMIHHYDSLALLEQRIFTVERPKSRLAKEYRQLTERVIGGNYGDRDVAQRYLGRMRRGSGYNIAPSEVESALKKIQKLHAADGEMLDSLAKANRALGREEVAKSLIAESQALGYESEEALVARLVLEYETGQVQPARETALKMLERPQHRFFTMQKLVKAIALHDSPFLLRVSEILGAQSAFNPEIRHHLAKQMMLTVDGAAAAECLLRPILSLNREIRNDLVLALMAQGKFKDAMAMIAKSRRDLAEGDTADAFNFAIAEWGAIGVVPRDLFARVAASQGELGDANYAQCRALAFWCQGDSENARKQAENALSRLDDTDPIFSCWRYLLVEPRIFREDIASLLRLIDANTGVPEVISRNKDLH